MATETIDSDTIEYTFDDPYYKQMIQFISTNTYQRQRTIINTQQRNAVLNRYTSNSTQQNQMPSLINLINQFANPANIANSTDISFRITTNNGTFYASRTTGQTLPIDNIFSQLLNEMIAAQEPVTSVLTEDALNKIDELTKQQLLEKLPELSEEEKCPICWDQIKEDDDEKKYVVLPCSHYFHSTCIKKYLKEYNYKCPNCKKECGDHISLT